MVRYVKVIDNPDAYPSTANNGGEFWQVLGGGGGGGGVGTVTSVSATDSNGFDFTVTNPSTTPTIALAITPAGVLKGTAGALAQATQGVDYYAPGGTDVAIADGGTGASTAAGARINLGTLGYAVQFTTVRTTVADATTYYFGSQFASALSTEPDVRIFIPKAGSIKACYLSMTNAGVAGSNETSTVSIRLNDTTDTTVTAGFHTDTTPLYFNNTGLNIAVVAGDWIVLKWVAPTYVTNPTNVLITGIIYIE